jgi:hypothetical protein
MFSSLVANLSLSEVTYCQVQSKSVKPLNSQEMQIKANRHFISFKILSLIAFSKIDLHALALKTEQREV